jgi:hypothetical protein
MRGSEVEQAYAIDTPWSAPGVVWTRHLVTLRDRIARRAAGLRPPLPEISVSR